MAPEIVITFRGPKPECLRVLRSLPALLSGRGHVFPAAARTWLARLGLATQKVLYDAFMEKADGRNDASGLRWPALHPLTIKLKRRTAPANAEKILREFDLLSTSLRPTIAPQEATGSPPGVQYQIFRLRPGSVTIGTNRPYVLTHHRGAGRIPQRRLWPKPINWPHAFWDRILYEVGQGTGRAIDELLRTNP